MNNFILERKFPADNEGLRGAMVGVGTTMTMGSKVQLIFAVVSSLNAGSKG